MTTILLALKILGITISGASIIGSERLKKIEAKFRILLHWDNIDNSFNRIFSSPRFLSIKFITGTRNILRRIVGASLESLNSSEIRLEEEVRAKINQPQRSKRQRNIKIVLQESATFIFSLLLLPIEFVLLIIFLVIWVIIVILAMLFFLLLIAVDFLVVILIQFLKLITWVISRPYVWLDLEVSKRGLESTIVVIGILIAITAEIFSTYQR